MDIFLEKVAYAKKPGDNQFLLSAELLKTVKADLIVIRDIADGTKLADKQARLKKRYEVVSIEGADHVVLKRKAPEYANYFIVSAEDAYNIIQAAHVESGHAGINETERRVSKLYGNVTRQSISCYIELCEFCQQKKQKKQAGVVIKPIRSSNFLSRGQVDLMDFQSLKTTAGYKWVFQYQDHFTKFCVLKPLKSKTAAEVAYNLIDVFCLLGAPCILQSDNGREFVNSIINELMEMWPTLKIVNGKPRHPQSQGSIEAANKTIKDKIIAWMRENDSTEWAEGLRFVQWQKNSCVNRNVGRSPYEALFCRKPDNGLAKFDLPEDVMKRLKTEEELKACTGIKDEDEHEEPDGQVAAADALESDAVIQIGDFCYVCGDEATEDSRVICEECQNPVHFTCCLPQENGAAAANYCLTCDQTKQASAIRLDVNHHQALAADKMVTPSKFCRPAKVGDTVRVRVPNVDRGKADLPNILAVVIDESDGHHTLGTKAGKLDTKFSCNQFEICNSKLIQLADVPEKSVSLRQAVAIMSIGGGQGFLRCDCTTKCKTARCKCKKEGFICNSRCHPGKNATTAKSRNNDH